MLYVDEEQGRAAVGRLFLRLLAGLPTDLTDSAHLHITSDEGLCLTQPEGLARLTREIERWHPHLLVLDSAQQALRGADENDAGAVGAAFATLFSLRETYDLAILLVHHRRKLPSQGLSDPLDLIRGSTAFTTQASTVWSARGAGGALDLVQVKRRGSTKTSLRLAYAADGDTGPIRLTGEPLVQDDGLQAVAELHVRDYLADRGSARTKDILTTCADTPPRTVKRAMTHLRDLGLVTSPRRGLWAIVAHETDLACDT